MTVTPANANVNVGDTLTLTVQVKDAQGNVVTGQNIVFLSSDTTKATVTTKGLVTAIAPGSIAITAKDSTSSATHSGKSQLALQAVQDNWTNYGHDAHRTSTSLASVTGPLTLSWHYVPPGATGHTFQFAEYALGTVNEVMLRSSLSINIGYGQTPSVDRVSTSGSHVWTYFMGSDADFGDWSAILGNRLVFNDDGIRHVDLTTGASVHGGGVDNWGESLTDSTVVYLVNGAQIDGAGVYVGAYDSAGKSLWTANKYSLCRGAAAALAGGLALNNGVLFYAPNYNKGADTVKLPYASGVYGFNAKTGAQVAFRATTPYSRMSADNANVYLVESQNALVARAQSDLHVVWSKPVTNPGEQAPLLVDGLVIIATAAGIQAYSPASGTLVWTSPSITGADAHWSETYQGGKCGNIQIPVQYGATTTMAAAFSSQTLVVTASDGIHILSLKTGAALWHAAIAGVPGQVYNPIIVNDPVAGATLYVVDYGGLYALKP